MNGEDGMDMMGFGGALEALKAGMKVARTGWNGKGMWPWLTSQADTLAEDWVVVA